ncbi:MAG: sulfotransferase family protein [Nocardioides sp.]|uniref:sulfotransferase family protein n=1 Tax=Nocardioides sp. TaxID=35761 RepID=UPI003F100FE6
MYPRPALGTYEEIADAAVRSTGLTDFGGTDHEEGLRVLVDDWTHRSGLTELGNGWKRSDLKGLLVGRLMAEHGYATNPSYADVAIERPVFVMGLTRSGTTMMQRLLTADPSHQGIEQWITSLPQPRPPRETWADNPIYAAMAAGFAAFHESNPELAGIHYSDADSHEECWRLLQQSGRSVSFESQAYVPGYTEWLQGQDWVPAYETQRRLLQLIGLNDADKRWVLKNPSHLMAADALRTVFPDALFVVTHRDPVTCIASSCSLAEASTRGQSTVFTGGTIGRTQLDMLAREQAAFAAARPSIPADQIVDVDYADLTGDPVGTVAGIYAHFGLPWDDSVQAAVADEHTASRQGPRAPKHAYDLADYGLTEAQVRDTLAY